MDVKARGILSPVCLPVSPLRHLCPDRLNMLVSSQRQTGMSDATPLNQKLSARSNPGAFALHGPMISEKTTACTTDLELNRIGRRTGALYSAF